jgi:hypothetical protein
MLYLTLLPYWYCQLEGSSANPEGLAFAQVLQNDKGGSI